MNLWINLTKKHPIKIQEALLLVARNVPLYFFLIHETKIIKYMNQYYYFR
jgi:hypothetical protein